MKIMWMMVGLAAGVSLSLSVYVLQLKPAKPEPHQLCMGCGKWDYVGNVEKKKTVRLPLFQLRPNAAKLMFGNEQWYHIGCYPAEQCSECHGDGWVPKGRNAYREKVLMKALMEGE